LVFSPVANYLFAGSWNKTVSCWEIASDGTAVAKAQTSHKEPVLCVAVSGDGKRVFSGSCDQTAKVWDLASNQSSVIGTHQAPIKEISWVNDINQLVTGSWDKTLRYWDPRVGADKPTANIQVGERVYCMDVRYPMQVVGTANRQIHIFDLRNPMKPYRTFDSVLRYQTRCVSIFVDKTGFAYGSIEGRCAISHVEEKDAPKNFAFKCHRIGDEVYAVNNICFHPKYGTFATCGSDGSWFFWDKDAKQRLKQYERNDQSITSSCFNYQGNIFAYAVSYDWSKGAENYDAKKGSQIYMHAVADQEVQPRKA